MLFIRKGRAPTVYSDLTIYLSMSLMPKAKIRSQEFIFLARACRPNILLFSDTTNLAPSPSPPQSSVTENFQKEVKFHYN